MTALPAFTAQSNQQVNCANENVFTKNLVPNLVSRAIHVLIRISSTYPRWRCRSPAGPLRWPERPMPKACKDWALPHGRASARRIIYGKKMNWPSCGNEIAPGGTFCGCCGTRIDAGPSPSQSPHGINLDTDGLVGARLHL